jgi:tetratricopeptide (TPR) repeat protein
MTESAEILGIVGDTTRSCKLAATSLERWQQVPIEGPAQERDRGYSYLIASRVYAAAEQADEARIHAESAVRVLEPLATAPDAAPLTLEYFAEANRVHGHTCNRPDLFDRAQQAFAQSRTFYEQLAEQHPNVSQYQIKRTTVGYSHALSFFLTKQNDEAITRLEANVGLARSLAARFPDDELPLLRSAADSLTLLAILHGRKQDFEQKLVTIEQSIEINQRIFDRSAGRLDAARSLAGALGELGACLFQLGRHDEAIDKFDESTRKLQAILDKDPMNGEARRFQSNNFQNKSKSLIAVELFQDALQALQRGIELARPELHDSLRGDEAVLLARLARWDESWSSLDAFAKRQPRNQTTFMETARKATGILNAVSHALGGPTRATGQPDESPAIAFQASVVDAAIAALDDACAAAEERDSFLREVETDPQLETLRAMPQYVRWARNPM